MNRAKFCVFLLAAALIAVCAIGAVSATENSADEAYGVSIYDSLTPEIIEIYEREISGAPVVSDKSAALISRTAKELGISQNKLKTIMLVQDLAAQLGEDISLSNLAAMSDIELFVYAKNKGTAYANTLSPARRDELKKAFLAALKKR